MKHLVTIKPIIWEQINTENYEGWVGDVTDRLDDGTPRLWDYFIYNHAHPVSLDESWATMYQRTHFGDQGVGSEAVAKNCCFEHKEDLVKKALESTDGGKDKAIGDTCFISEIINDLKSRGFWMNGKAETMLRDWRNELMELAKIEDESEIKAIHAERCGAANWGIEEEDEEE